MSRVLLGIICGIVFGAVSVAMMLPLKFEDRKTAMAGSFVNRFAIGFVIGATNLPLAGWLNGLFFGLLLSLPEAIITKSWIPILVLGAIGGVVVGSVVSAWRIG